MEPVYVQVVWLDQLLKLTASSQTVYLTLPPTSPAVPPCCAICACLVCSFASSSFTCLDSPPKPVFPGSPPKVASYYCGSTQGQDKGVSASYPKCAECISLSKSSLLDALLDFRISFKLLYIKLSLKKKKPKNMKQLKLMSSNNRADHYED